MCKCKCVCVCLWVCTCTWLFLNLSKPDRGKSFIEPGYVQVLLHIHLYVQYRSFQPFYSFQKFNIILSHCLFARAETFSAPFVFVSIEICVGYSIYMFFSTISSTSFSSSFSFSLTFSFSFSLSLPPLSLSCHAYHLFPSLSQSVSNPIFEASLHSIRMLTPTHY